jgi:RNA-directed DNA polymerase
MPKSWVVKLLAKAFLAGEAAPDAIVERSAKILGRRWNWLRPLALRYLSAFSERPAARYRDVVRFLSTDDGFLKARWRHRGKLEVAQWITESPGMQPVEAAESWPLPPIETVGELANWFEISPNELEWFADLKGLSTKNDNQRLRHYRYRVLQKDLSSLRLIEAPKPRLKQLQSRILSGILEQIPMHDAAHGFRKGRSIQTFCAPHVGRQMVLRMDLRDFFTSISRARIQALFRTIGYPETVADLFGGLCSNAAPKEIWKSAATGARTWETQMLYARPHLPQGAPTSPALANLCVYRADCRLRGLADAAGASYTRYADDVAFSGGEAFARCAERFSLRAAAILSEEGFEVHHRKTRIMRRSVRQHLAGLVVNERANIHRADFDQLKAILTNCIRLGPATQNRLEHPRFRAHLQGKVAFMTSIHPTRGQKLKRLLAQINWD